MQFINLRLAVDKEICASIEDYLFNFCREKGASKGHRRLEPTVKFSLKTNGDRVFTEKVRKLRLGLTIGYHSVELRQRTNAGGLGFTELAVIGHQDFLLCHGHCPVFHFQLVKIKAGGAMLQAQTGGGDKGDIRADMIQLVVLADGGENVVVRLEFTAAQDHFAVRFVLERQKGI